MTYKTHLIGGAQIGILLAYLHKGTAVDTSLIIGASLIGSVIPDIDHPNSKIAKSDLLIGGISKGISNFTSHRGFTHTVPGAIAFAILFFIIGSFRTGREFTIAALGSMLVFILMFAMKNKKITRLSGTGAILTYLFTPNMISYFTTRNIGIEYIPEIRESTYLLAISIFAGCLMHMLYDSFTKSGISWLYPFTKKRFKLGRLKTNTIGEIYFRIVQMLILVIITSLVCKNLGLIESIVKVTKDFGVNFHMWG